MRAILEVGAARFIVEGHSFEALCCEVVSTLSPLVTVDPQTICLSVSFDAFVAQAINEEALLDDAERERSAGAAHTTTTTAAVGHAAPRGPAAAGGDWRHSAATHRVLSGRRFSGMPNGVQPNLLHGFEGKSVRVGPAVRAATHRLYLYSQDTFENAEAVLEGLTEEAKAREARMLVLGLLSAPRDTPTACALPTVVLDTIISTSAPVAPYYNADGKPCRRRSLPTANEEAAAATAAASSARPSAVADPPCATAHNNNNNNNNNPVEQDAVLLPPEVKAQLERHSYAPYLQAVVTPATAFRAAPPYVAPTPSVTPTVTTSSAPYHTQQPLTRVPLVEEARPTPTLEAVEAERRWLHAHEVHDLPPPPPSAHAQPPGHTEQEDGLVHSPPPSAARGTGLNAGLGMPPFAPRQHKPMPRMEEAPPPTSAAAPARVVAENARHNTRCMTFQRGVRVDVAELITGKPSRPGSAVASPDMTTSPAPVAPHMESGSNHRSDAPAATSLAADTTTASQRVHSALASYPYPMSDPAVAERRHSAGHTSVASSSAILSGMRTPLPGITAEERQVVERLLLIDDMTPLRQRTPSLLRSMPITGSSTNVDVTSAALLPVAPSERAASAHPYNSVTNGMHGARPRLQSAPHAAGRQAYHSGGGDGSLPRVQSAPRGNWEGRQAGGQPQSATYNARSNYNQLFSFTPVSDKYAKLLEDH